MKVKIEIVRGVFGHASMYLANRRVAGEKPWGGGTVTQSLLADTETIREALARAEEADREDLSRCYTAEQLDAMRHGSIVVAGALHENWCEYKQTKHGWRRVHAESKRAFGDALSSSDLADMRARQVKP